MSQYPKETPVLESLFKKVAGLKPSNFIRKRSKHRCFPVNIAKFLILLSSKNNCKRLLFDFFNGSLLHRPKGSRFRLYDSVRLQGPTHRSSFLFLSWYEPSPSSRPAFENLRRIPLMNQLSFYIGCFWSFQMVLGRFISFLSLVSTNSYSLTNSSLNLCI